MASSFDQWSGPSRKLGSLRQFFLSSAWLTAALLITDTDARLEDDGIGREWEDKGMWNRGEEFKDWI